MLSPLPDKDWNRYAAAHLLNRAGFGGTPDEIETIHAKGLNRAVDDFLRIDDESDLFPDVPVMMPEERAAIHEKLKAATNEEEKHLIRKFTQDTDRFQIQEMRIWWLNRMRYTSNPLSEKILLFWHGHFATSNQKVNEAFLMREQMETFRRHALGKFPAMLKAVSRDPAMIKWLDLGQSRKDHPNENFARELMELFSLGEGHYTEKDIQESAKAFTGYRVDHKTGGFRMVRRDFDPGLKTFFGRTGPFTGDDIIDMIVADPQCARFLARKLWVYFVAENPSEETVSAVSEILISNGYDVGKTLGMIFRSAAFYDAKVVHQQIKGPVQWMIQTTRMLEIPLPDAKVLESSLSLLGQVLFAPPNVKGWDGGRAWISASSLLFRYNLGAYLLSGKARILGGGGTKTASIPLEMIAPAAVRTDPDRLIEHLAFRIFNYPLPDKDRNSYRGFLGVAAIGDVQDPGKNLKNTPLPVPYTDSVVRDLMQIMMSTPFYQMT